MECLVDISGHSSDKETINYYKEKKTAIYIRINLAVRVSSRGTRSRRYSYERKSCLLLRILGIFSIDIKILNLEVSICSVFSCVVVCFGNDKGAKRSFLR